MAQQSSPPARPFRGSAFLLLLLLLAFALRLSHLDHFSFWTDEGLTPLRAGYPVAEILSNRVIIQEGITRDTHPPFFYLIIHFSRRLLGESDFAYRYPSLLAGLLLVPLLFQFGRRLHGPALGWLAALFTAVNPLHIWYAHEARMYTLFVLLAAAMSYILWRAISQPSLPTRRLRRYVLWYGLLAALTIYTHYTAVFLIGAQGLFWAWLLWRRGQRRLLLGMAAVAVVAAVPLIPFTVPRLFTGAEASYFYVSPLIMLQDVIHGFGQGLSADVGSPGVYLVDGAALALLLLGLAAARSPLRRAFLLVYLLAVVLGLMGGSFIKPMYQGVRHIMVSSPAFLLLVAWGVRDGWQRRAAYPLYGVFALGAGLVTLAGSAVSLNNLYRQPQYAKDDFRGLVWYIERHAGDRDVVVYNNAILLPLHEHYRQRPDVAVTASPIYPYAADGVTAQLAELAQTYERIWFVTDPPADRRDTDHAVRRWLDAHLTPVHEQIFHARTTVVAAVVYANAPRAEATLPPDGRLHTVQWPDLPALHGLQLHFEQPTALPTLWLDLFWQNSPIPPEGAYLRLSLQGPDGREWLARNGPLATNAWPTIAEASLLRHSYYLALPPAMPPGNYTLLAQPLAGADGPSLGEARPLTDLSLAGMGAWPAGVARPSAINTPLFANGLALRGVEMPAGQVRPGHNLPLTLYWQSNTPLTLAEVQYRLEVVGRDGELLRWQAARPGAAWLDTWPAGAWIREQTGLYFPPESAPGRYRLRWRLLHGDDTIPGRPIWRPWSGETSYFGEVEVAAWPLATAVPPNATLLQADYGPAIQLAGYELAGPADDMLQLILYWRAHAAPPINYFTFVHLVAPGGEIVVNDNRTPADWLRPTRGWRAGEVITDAYTLALPADLPAGDYMLNVGLFDPDTQERPPVTAHGERQPLDQFTVTYITIP
jgi:hypothetical protein